ncbi:uncharacterized protein LOC124554063 isoform X2 [Schistocerca americana]|uniref:uncharacterized protein LOC124554063 isoform X2 n=1 Tax=Schistocerca americana TaxID=7009 RepID=UPI001F50352A|nr:uncharacterized protein LOC124554063 isoform X2 [Schistocerca americana]XP_049944993.1 uncharacterized protein LOC126426928 isoform X2 [Schistocerca serialis cubense]
MGPGALLMLAAAAAVAGITSANIALAGPYAMKAVDFGACDDGEYPGMLVNVSLILDEAANETAYTGEFTTTYDYLADDCEMEITVYKWGSTGGWLKFYDLTFTKPFDYLLTNFPAVFEYIWYPMGINKKPVPPLWDSSHLWEVQHGAEADQQVLQQWLCTDSGLA